jgi:hypothetical protein
MVDRLGNIEREAERDPLQDDLTRAATELLDRIFFDDGIGHREYAAAVVGLCLRHHRGAVYPRDEGDVTIIGPECFAAKDGSVLNWRGVNYVPQPDPPGGQS